MCGPPDEAFHETTGEVRVGEALTCTPPGTVGGPASSVIVAAAESPLELPTASIARRV